MQELVAAIPVWYFEMHGQSCFRRAQWSDVQIVNSGDLRHRCQICFHFVCINTRWHDKDDLVHFQHNLTISKTLEQLTRQ